jgi:pyruvate dehydrogenase E1 component alpha subunit
MRNGDGPRFLELVTYRHYGHVDWRDDIDVGVDRSLDDVQSWKERDPITRLSIALINNNIWTKDDEDTYCDEIDQKISSAWAKAMNDPYPKQDSTLNHVYATNNNKS